MDTFQSRAGFSECLDIRFFRVRCIRLGSFNPVLGFLSVSTTSQIHHHVTMARFQSRAGFSECLDPVGWPADLRYELFQSRAGFSECLDHRTDRGSPSLSLFQSRAGFSECLDQIEADEVAQFVFQSRAGFSECLDPTNFRSAFGSLLFQSLLGFLSVSTSPTPTHLGTHSVSIPCWVF